MADNVSTTVELKQQQLDYLDEMAKKYNLPDRSKAVRCLVTFLMQEEAHEASVFTDIRCANC